MWIHLPYHVLLGLTVVAFIAGFIDALAGGGGLINLPALLFAGLNPAYAFGTLKLQAICAELSASLHFFRRGEITIKPILWGIPFIIFGGAVGTICLQLTPVPWLEKMIPYLLLAVFIWFLFMKPPKVSAPTESHDMDFWFLMVFGLGIGFYNGFFGPGTGSIWVVCIMAFMKWDIRLATMYAKPLNSLGNVGALAIFLFTGKIAMIPALCMAVAAFLGGRMGAHMVIYKDVKWLRFVFILLMLFSIIGTFFKYR